MVIATSRRGLRGRACWGGHACQVPQIWTGRQVTLCLTAGAAAPRLKAPGLLALRERVPSGKIRTDALCQEFTRQSARRVTGLAGSSDREGVEEQPRGKGSMAASKEVIGCGCGREVSSDLDRQVGVQEYRVPVRAVVGDDDQRPVEGRAVG